VLRVAQQRIVQKGIGFRRIVYHFRSVQRCVCVERDTVATVSQLVHGDVLCYVQVHGCGSALGHDAFHDLELVKLDLVTKKLLV